MTAIAFAVLSGLIGWAFVSILESAGVTRRNWQLWAALLCVTLAQALVAAAFLMEKVA